MRAFSLFILDFYCSDTMLSITLNPIRITSNTSSLLKYKALNKIWWQNSIFISLLWLLLPCVLFVSYHFYNLNQKPQEFFLIIALLSLLLVGLGLLSEWGLLAVCFLTSLQLPASQQGIILTGFGNHGIHIILTILLTTSLIQKSTILSRTILLLLIKISNKEAFLDRALFFIGVLITPLVTSQSARVSIISSILDNIIVNNKIKAQSNHANALANAGFFGCILLSSVFLSGKSSNYLLLTIMYHQGGHNGWLSWLYFASLPGVLLIGAFLLLQNRSFKKPCTIALSRYTLIKSYKVLGAVTKKEQNSLFYAFLLLNGLLLSPYLNVNLIFLDALVIVLAIRRQFIKTTELYRLVNWSCIVYLATIIGLMKFLSHVDLMQWNLGLKDSLIHLMGNSYSCIGFVFLISWVLGFVFGTMITPGLVLTVLYPLLIELHINLWIIGFVILIATESWIFPYQSSYFLCFKKLTSSKKHFALKPILKTNSYFVLIKILVLFASVPFWKLLKLI